MHIFAVKYVKKNKIKKPCVMVTLSHSLGSCGDNAFCTQAGEIPMNMEILHYRRLPLFISRLLSFPVPIPLFLCWTESFTLTHLGCQWCLYNWPSRPPPPLWLLLKTATIVLAYGCPTLSLLLLRVWGVETNIKTSLRNVRGASVGKKGADLHFVRETSLEPYDECAQKVLPLFPKFCFIITIYYIYLNLFEKVPFFSKLLLRKNFPQLFISIGMI